MKTPLLASATVLMACVAIACGSSSDNPSGGGAAAGAAGNATGGSATGGSATGGSATGGTGAGDSGTADAAQNCSGIDLQTDANNCGSCGHSCLGGSCVAGACKPFEVYKGNDESSFMTLALTDSDVFVGDFDTQALYKVPLKGGAAQKFADIDVDWAAEKTASDEENLYLASDDGLLSINKSTGAIKKLTDVGEVEDSDVVLSDGVLHFARGPEYGGEIVRYELSSGKTTTVAELESNFSWGWRALHTSAGRVAWADHITISWAPTAGGAVSTLTVTPVTTPGFVPFALRIDETAVFALVQEQSNSSFASLQRIPFDESKESVIVVSEDGPTDLELIGKDVYLLENPLIDSKPHTRIRRFPKDGTTGTVLYSGEGRPLLITKDQVSLFVLEETRVLRLAL